MNRQQILEILKDCAEKLDIVRLSETYQNLESSNHFHTPNDLDLMDAIQAICEVEGAITNLP